MLFGYSNKNGRFPSPHNFDGLAANGRSLRLHHLACLEQMGVIFLHQIIECLAYGRFAIARIITQLSPRLVDIHDKGVIVKKLDLAAEQLWRLARYLSP